MALMRAIGDGPVALDTARFIYFIEEHVKYPLSAALARRCTAFVTNDRDLPPIPGLRILQLRDYLS